MKMTDYNSSTPALQAEHLDKWHTFNQVVPQTRIAAGWLQKKQYLQNSALVLTWPTTAATVAFNNSVNSVATRLALTITGTATSSTLGATISGGDILQFTNGTTTFNATVYSITEASAGPLPAIITFEETTYDAALVWGTTNVSLNAVSVTVPRYRTENNGQSSTVWTYQPTMSQINIKAHGIDLYQYLPYQFYATYLPYTFGGPNINTPVDKGCHLINFALFPGTYQPSGHVNISRAREFFFNYQSNVIGSNAVVAPSVVNQPTPSTNSNSGLLYLLASAINFLLISDGGAVLRYST